MKKIQHEKNKDVTQYVTITVFLLLMSLLLDKKKAADNTLHTSELD